MTRSMLYAFDGTWNDDSDPKAWTNVYRLATCLHREHCRYYPGVGSWADTRGSLLGRLLGGAFAAGLSDIIRTAFADWRRDREHGVTVVDVIGFSRGSMAAIDFVGKIREFERDQRVPRAQRCTLRFLGCFDAVDAMGLPDLDWDPFYHKGLPTQDGFARAVHAVALHETRATFQVVDVPGMDAVVGFIGNHCDIGGGYLHRGLSDITLQWMYESAAAAGVTWDRDLRHCSPKSDDRLLPHRETAANYAHQPRRWPKGITFHSGYRHWPRADQNFSGDRLPHFPLLKPIENRHRRRSPDKRPVPLAPEISWAFIHPDRYTAE